MQVPAASGQGFVIPRAHATTIVGVRRDGTVAIAGDGQVTVGDVVMKHRASKVRRLHHDTVLAGFAGAVADALTLFDKFEQQLDRHQGQLLRAAVGLAKEWRTDRYLRHLEAMLIVADREQLLLLSGDGEIIEPDDDLAAIGSGGPLPRPRQRRSSRTPTSTPRRWRAGPWASPHHCASTPITR